MCWASQDSGRPACRPPSPGRAASRGCLAGRRVWGQGSLSARDAREEEQAGADSLAGCAPGGGGETCQARQSGSRPRRQPGSLDLPVWPPSPHTGPPPRTAHPVLTNPPLNVPDAPPPAPATPSLLGALGVHAEGGPVASGLQERGPRAKLGLCFVLNFTVPFRGRLSCHSGLLDN